MYLLDTNVCIDFLLGRSDPLAVRLERAFGTLAVSAISVAELRVGSRVSADPTGDLRRVDLFVSALHVAPFDDRAAAAYGRMIRATGMKRNSFDRLIGAHAIALDAILVTRNEADFADMPGLRIEDWTLPP